MSQNVERKPGFLQVCVWEGTIVQLNHIQDFEAYMLKEFGARVQFLEEILTGPDTDQDGLPVPGTGGRPDVFFAVHSEDVPKFCIPRLLAGIRWIEDVLWSTNYRSRIYPDRVFDYRTCNPDAGCEDDDDVDEEDFDFYEEYEEA